MLLGIADENTHRRDGNSGGFRFVRPILSRDAVDRIHDDPVDVLRDQLVNVVRLGQRVDVGIEVYRLDPAGLLGRPLFALLQRDGVGEAQAQMGRPDRQRLVFCARRSRQHTAGDTS
jgi:hypothetical protein